MMFSPRKPLTIPQPAEACGQHGHGHHVQHLHVAHVHAHHLHHSLPAAERGE